MEKRDLGVFPLYTKSMRKSVLEILSVAVCAMFSASCSNTEVINYFVEYRVHDDKMGIIYDADQSSETGYAVDQQNRYQTVNWGQDAQPVVAVPKTGFVFDHWEKYAVFVDASSFVMTVVSLDDGHSASRFERCLYDNLVLIACFAEASI